MDYPYITARVSIGFVYCRHLHLRFVGGLWEELLSDPIVVQVDMYQLEFPTAFSAFLKLGNLPLRQYAFNLGHLLFVSRHTFGILLHSQLHPFPHIVCIGQND